MTTIRHTQLFPNNIMKALFSSLISVFALFFSAKAQEVVLPFVNYTYDAAGNRVMALSSPGYFEAEPFSLAPKLNKPLLLDKIVARDRVESTASVTSIRPYLNYPIDIYDNAIYVLALGDLAELYRIAGADSLGTPWLALKEEITSNVRKHLWDPERHKFHPHIYLDGSPFPEDLDEEAIYYRGAAGVLFKADEMLRAAARQKLESK